MNIQRHLREIGYYLSKGFLFDSVKDEIMQRNRGKSTEKLKLELQEGIKIYNEYNKNLSIKKCDVEKYSFLCECAKALNGIEEIENILRFLNKKILSESEWSKLEEILNKIDGYFLLRIS